jgi:hypothetical protein
MYSVPWISAPLISRHQLGFRFSLFEAAQLLTARRNQSVL